MFLEKWAAWQSVVPPNLRREDPKVLLRFMELSASSEGIFQQELKLALGLNQSRLSKLAAKLVMRSPISG
jgi:hypothetical protein